MMSFDEALEVIEDAVLDKQDCYYFMEMVIHRLKEIEPVDNLVFIIDALFKLMQERNTYE
jgi:hypothetical protein